MLLLYNNPTATIINKFRLEVSKNKNAIFLRRIIDTFLRSCLSPILQISISIKLFILYAFFTQLFDTRKFRL